MINEYEEILSEIKSYKKPFTIMEVCGTHTMNIGKFGIRDALPSNINILSGPGCPICVTPASYIDYIYNLAMNEDVIIATYGDMVRVPGSKKENTLEKVNSIRGNVKIVYSSVDALNIAKNNRNKKVVFLGLGFETTMPASIVALNECENNNINNFYILSIHKSIKPALEKILDGCMGKINGILCPGNVAVIIGSKEFEFLDKYNVSSVICGFNRREILTSIKMLLDNYTNEKALLNNYKIVVSRDGNLKAQKCIGKYFKLCTDEWRGIGKIEKSSYKLKEQYEKYDIEKIYSFEKYGGKESENKGCRCGDILQGKAKPKDCKFFGGICNIENPIGPCMVSSEGACAAYYKYSF